MKKREKHTGLFTAFFLGCTLTFILIITIAWCYLRSAPMVPLILLTAASVIGMIFSAYATYQTNRDIKKFIDILVLCKLMQYHEWTCKAEEGIKPTTEQIMNMPDGFWEYAKCYCGRCGKESKFNRK